MDGLDRREFLTATAAAAALATLPANGAPSKSRRNVVFILIDDMRFDSLGCMGHPFLETPHIDSLAQGGMMFNRAYVTTALCSPSRASILTGTYAHRHGVLDNQSPLPEDLTTFPQVLHEAGYRTGFVGKWHMGGESDAPRPGFDHWASFRGQGVYENPTLNINGTRSEVQGYTTDILTEQAEQFLRAQGDGPFFLYLSHKAVHADFVAAPRHAGCYAGKQYPHPTSMANTEENYAGKPHWVRAQRQSWHGVDGMYNKTVDFDQFAIRYAETMRAVDDSVGRVMDTLRELRLLEDTLVIFTSDNGFLFGEHGLIDKRCMYEPSIRVPLIAHCPAFIAAGTQCERLVINVDFAPTFLELAGYPASDTMQGRSILPLFRGEQPPWREAFLYEYFWERSFPQTPSVLGVHDGRFKFMKFHGVWDKYEIYDLKNDPEELHNLLGEFLAESESGTLDNLINREATGDTKELFQRMQRLLDEQLKAAGCRREPSWRA